MKQLSSYGKGRLLYASAKEQLFYEKNSFWLQRGDVRQRLCQAPRERKYALLCHLPLAARMLRLEPRCATVAEDGSYLVSLHGGICRLTEKGICWEHRYRKGMNNPLTFARIQGIQGFSDGVAYGEYFSNDGKEPVRLWQRQAGQWQPVYTFPAGSVCHIHGIVPAPEHGCVYVLTGDTDAESAIWEFRDGFCSCKKLIGGSQCCRSCVAFPWGTDLVYATDTPLEANGIYCLTPATGQIRLLAQLPGPVIYGASKGDQMIFATSVEPDARVKGLRYLLTYRRGTGVTDWRSHILAGDPDTGFREIASGKKDLLPMGLFQFGNFLFPPATDGQLYAVGQSLMKYDGKTVRLYYE